MKKSVIMLLFRLQLIIYSIPDELFDRNCLLVILEYFCIFIFRVHQKNIKLGSGIRSFRLTRICIEIGHSNTIWTRTLPISGFMRN
jgi:hypothetical protein